MAGSPTNVVLHDERDTRPLDPAVREYITRLAFWRESAEEWAFRCKEISRHRAEWLGEHGAPDGR